MKANVNFSLPANLYLKEFHYGKDLLSTPELLFLNLLTKKTLSVIEDSLGGMYNPYICIQSQYLMKLMGNKYRKLLHRLTELGIIHPFLKNGKQPYLSGAKAKELGRDSFPKSYAYCPQFIHGLKEPQRIKKDVKFCRARKPCIDTAILDSEASIKLAENLKLVEWINVEEMDAQEFEIMQRIKDGVSNSRQSKNNGRLYHIGIKNKSVRQYMAYQGEKLIPVDSTRCQPKLLAHFIADPEEKQRYLDFVINTDIYTVFRNLINATSSAANQVTRDQVKKLWGVFISGKSAGRFQWAVSLMKAYHNQRFPVLMAWLGEKKEGLKNAGILQRLESSIFIDRCFIKAPFFALTVHDCLLVRGSDEEKARELINQEAMAVVGYPLI